MASSVASSTLRDLHDELDRLVAEAYGWTWPEPSTVILDRLVALHDRRVEEERAGTVRWLRAVVAPSSVGAPWPSDAIGQITALSVLTATRTITVDEAMLHFAGARRDLVARHLETLAIGEAEASDSSSRRGGVGSAREAGQGARRRSRAEGSGSDFR